MIYLRDDGSIIFDIENGQCGTVPGDEFWEGIQERIRNGEEVLPAPEEVITSPEPNPVEEAKAYLSSTDYMVIKCAELGVDMETEYPGVIAERQSCRNVINELEGKA